MNCLLGNLPYTNVHADRPQCDGAQTSAKARMRILGHGLMNEHPTHGPRLLQLAAVVFFAVLLVTGPGGSPVLGQTSSPHTTVVVFSDRPMHADQWSSLFAAVRAGAVNGGEETRLLDQNATYIRGDEVEPGLLVQSSISVYLHGDCTLSPLAYRSAYGVPLGWVRRVEGRIEPFVHVDCTRIGEVLGPEALHMSRSQREQAMSEAVSRVILHEWIHIASQNSSHAESGIAKPAFGVADLMGGR
jgi:hypothetical protein